MKSILAVLAGISVAVGFALLTDMFMQTTHVFPVFGRRSMCHRHRLSHCLRDAGRLRSSAACAGSAYAAFDGVRRFGLDGQHRRRNDDLERNAVSGSAMVWAGAGRYRFALRLGGGESS